MSPSRELVPVAKPARGRPPRWRSVLDAAWRLLRRTARSPLARRLALTVLLATLAVGIVGVSYATADVPVRARPAGRASQAAGAAAGERAPDRRSAAPSATRPPEQPGTTPARRNPPATRAGGAAGQPERVAGRAGQAAGPPGQASGRAGQAAGPSGARADQPHGLGSQAGATAGRQGEVAVAWYAARLGLPAGRVRALGSQRIGPGQARVLVLADAGPGRLATAWVGVHRTRGGWAVTP